MKVKILHLYYNIMNLYGEYANVVVLNKHLQDLGCTTEVTQADFSETLSLKDYDFIYMGSGTERNQKIVLKDFTKYFNEIKECAELGKVMLFTGNAMELLGKTITDSQGQEYICSHLGKFRTVEQDKKRYTSDSYCISEMFENPVIGFINKCSEIFDVERPIFDVKLGYGNNSKENKEGFKYKNVIGTHLIGPLLVKNPEFMRYIIKNIYIQNKEDIPNNMPYYEYEENSYKISEHELKLRIEELKK